MSTFGEQCVTAIRDYITRYSTPWSKLNGKIVAELIDRYDQQRKERLRDEKSRKAKETRTANQGRFVPPSAQEVEAYFKEIGYSCDPKAFVDFYEMRGWKAGGKPMASWKAACRQAKTCGWTYGKPVNGYARQPSASNKLDAYIEPDRAAWKATTARLFPGVGLENNNWADISITLRSDILRALPKTP